MSQASARPAEDPDISEVSGATSSPKGRLAGHYREHVTKSGPLDSNNRRNGSCSYCSHEYISMRKEMVFKHLSDECKGVTKEIKKTLSDRFADKPPPTVPAHKRTRFGKEAAVSKASSGASGSSIKHFTSTIDHCPPAAQAALDTKGIRAFVHAGVPFNVAEGPYWQDWLHDMRPSYVVQSTKFSSRRFKDMLAYSACRAVCPSCK